MRSQSNLHFRPAHEQPWKRLIQQRFRVQMWPSWGQIQPSVDCRRTAALRRVALPFDNKPFGRSSLNGVRLVAAGIVAAAFRFVYVKRLRVDGLARRSSGAAQGGGGRPQRCLATGAKIYAAAGGGALWK